MADKYKVVIRMPEEVERQLKVFVKDKYSSINREVLIAICKHIKFKKSK